MHKFFPVATLDPKWETDTLLWPQKTLETTAGLNAGLNSAKRIYKLVIPYRIHWIVRDPIYPYVYTVINPRSGVGNHSSEG